jgi:pimeloyl-ACP methyl ester carboxylesterase
VGWSDRLSRWRQSPPAFLHQIYDQVSPDGPHHSPVVWAKMLDMIGAEPQIDLAEFARISAPTLVLQGDHDEVRVEHSAALVEALRAGRLAVLPGSHALPVESPALVNPLIRSFLQGDPPSAMSAPIS